MDREAIEQRSLSDRISEPVQQYVDLDVHQLASQLDEHMGKE